MPGTRLGQWRFSSGGRNFSVDQGLLALNPPRIARQRSVVPHHAVTRYGDREVVRGAGTGNRTYGSGRTNSLRDFCVGNCLADRDLLERLPHPPLEGSAADVKRQIETEPRGFDQADNARHKGFVVPVGSDQAGFGKTILQITHQLIRVVAKKNGGYSLLARRDQDRAERCLTDSKQISSFAPPAR